MNAAIRDRILLATAAAATAALIGFGFAGAANADPYNTGHTISGCTYCHTGRIPPRPIPSTTTTQPETNPEDEGSDGFISRP